MPREEGDTFLRWSLWQRQVACSTPLTCWAPLAGAVLRWWRLGAGWGSAASLGEPTTPICWLWEGSGRVLLFTRDSNFREEWLPKCPAYPFCFWGWRGWVLAGTPDVQTGRAAPHPSTKYCCSQLNWVSNLKPPHLQKPEGMGKAGLWRAWPVGRDLREGLAKCSKLWARRVMELDRKHFLYFLFSCTVSFLCDEVCHT